MKTRKILLCGLFGALTAVFSQLVLPLGVVPVSLATLIVLLGAGLLGARLGALSQILYVFLGAIGLPVFHGMQGGLGILAGPTGGFLLGYIVCAWVTGTLLEKNFSPTWAMIAGTAVCYCFGSLWFWVITGGPAWSVLLSCVLPFLPGDALKIVAAVQLVKRLKGKIFL